MEGPRNEAVVGSSGPATSVRGNMSLLWVLANGGGQGVEISWGFGVIASCFGGERARGWGLLSESFLSRAVGRRLICQVKIRG